MALTKDVLLYTKTTGFNYNQRPEELVWDGQGNCELVDCVNTFIDKTGTLSRALGNTLEVTFSDTPHTVFDDGDRVFVGVGNTLYSYNSTTGPVAVKSDCSGFPISIVSYAGVVYCCDGASCFKISGNITSPWVFTQKLGAKTTKIYASPMIHTKSFVSYGRIFILVSGILFYSEPIGPDMFCYAQNVIWDKDGIIAVEGVNGCIVISTSKTVYTLTGEDFEKVTRTVISNTPVIQNTMTSGVFKAEKIICFTLRNGLHAVCSDGKVVRLTENKIPYEFFKLRVFNGASLIHERYTIYGDTETYAIDLETKGIEKHTVPFTKVSGNFGVQGVSVKRLEQGVLADLTVESKVIFQAVHFNSPKSKSIRRLYTRGMFAKVTNWLFQGDFGKLFTTVKAGDNTNTLAHEFTVQGSYKVYGQTISITFSTFGDFSINEIRILPLISTTRRL